MADIQEVIDVLVKAKGLSQHDFEAVKRDKSQKRGGFEKRIFLESVQEDE